MRDNSHDTIAALATPPGLGGIAIIRMSGPRSLSIGKQIFLSPKPVFAFIPRYMHYGHIIDAAGVQLDEVLAVFMPGPASATGEDVLEIHCHGGMGIASIVLGLIFSRGARLAEPGEFTRRAFMNGRIDLIQAEAVAELITASSKESVRLAKAKMEGQLGLQLRQLRDSVDELRVRCIVAVDFADDIEEIPQEELALEVEEVKGVVARLIASYERARLWREGASVVLVGQVNAGKSSLFNAFLGRNRALVSAEAGTTRDYLEESISIDGMPVRLFDTAGLREAHDSIEIAGIELSHSLASEADLLVLVVDSCVGLQQAEWEFLANYAQQVLQGRILLVWNKVDEIDSLPVPDVSKTIPVVSASVKQGHGLEHVATKIKNCLLTIQKAGLASDVIISDLAPNLRQYYLLVLVAEELDCLAGDIKVGFPVDILGERVSIILSYLDEALGTTPTDELLSSIFSNFCIGK